MIDFESLKGKIILVDIDGTLVRDGAVELSEESKSLLAKLREYGDVYLVSNTSDETRVLAIARDNNVNALTGRARKPSPKIISSFDNPNEKEFAVIGNQWLTDGLFARRIGATFARVLHVRHDDDSILTKLRYALDDMLYPMRGVLGALYSYALLIRPRHWVKNILVFAPLFFGHAFLEPSLFLNALIAFGVFSVFSSAMYVLNDIVDVEQDRLHPKKFFRPLPSGQVSVGGASGVALLLIAVGALGLYVLPQLVLVIGAYLALNILYSYFLKHIAVVDVIAVATFYPLRVIAGAIATGIVFSSWIILCVFFLALFIVLAKRRAEFSRSVRRVALDGYSAPALDAMLSISAGIAVVTYGIYSAIGTENPYLVYSTAFVALAVLRLLNRMYTDSEGSEYPETFLFNDRVVSVTFILWVVYLYGAIYFI